MLQQLIKEKWFTADGVIGFWPAASNNADTVTLHTEKGVVKLESLRQQLKKAVGQPSYSLSDFIMPSPTPSNSWITESPSPDTLTLTGDGAKAPSRPEEISETNIKESSNLISPPVVGGQGADYMGAFAVTIHGAKKYIDRFAADQDDYNKILVQILADRFVEAFAECLHEKTRKEYWGYEKNETLTNEQMIREEYKGIRPAPGYPACPDHTEKIKLFDLLNVTENIAIEITESLAMNPPASVCGWYIAHPQSHYFGLGKIAEDQLKDYAQRKGMSMEEAEKWLRPVLE
jgi:5-methyltetrahydrofolate--homocysteine methyltransferase